MAESVEITPRFPTAPGILLGLSAAFHLAALIEGLLGIPANSAVYFLIAQFTLSLASLRLYDGKWVLQDIRMIFVIFFFLYGGTLPLIVYFGVGALEPGLTGSAYMYGTAFLGFNLVQWWYKQPWHDVPRESFQSVRVAPLNFLLLALAFVGLIGYAAARGISPSLMIDRSQVRHLGTQLWVVAMFMMHGFFMYMFTAWTTMSRKSRIGAVLALLAFVLLQLQMGNRRDFLPILIFLFGIIATKRHMVVRLGTLIFGFTTFAVFTAVGVVRQIIQDPAVLTRFNPVELIATQNEFVSPIFTLMHYVTSQRPIRWGFTYLAAPGLFVPRAIWPDKPESLSLQFMRDAFGTTNLMGFAYTPVTEAFLNFSWVGPFLVFAIMSIGLVKLVRTADVHPGFYFICFAYVVDYNRGDFGGTFYSIVVAGTAYAIMSVASRLMWTSGNRQMSWTPRSGAPIGEATIAPRA